MIDCDGGDNAINFPAGNLVLMTATHIYAP